MKQNLAPIHFQHFRLIFIIFMSIFYIEEILMCTLFEVGEGLKKKDLYTCENGNILDSTFYDIFIFVLCISHNKHSAFYNV